jgi:hypothetical protein
VIEENMTADEITLQLPAGQRLSMSIEDARGLSQRLWDIATHPGAATLAVRINDEVSGPPLLAKTIVVSEREHGALRRVLPDQT